MQAPHEKNGGGKLPTRRNAASYRPESEENESSETYLRKMQPTIISSSSYISTPFLLWPLSSLFSWLAPFFHFSSDDDSRRVGRGTLKTREGAPPMISARSPLPNTCARTFYWYTRQLCTLQT